MTRIVLQAALAAAAALGSVSDGRAAASIESSNYTETVSKACTAGLCPLTFSTIPNGKYLMITDVGCSMISPAAAALGRIYLDATLGSGGQSSAIGPSFLEPVLIASVDGKNYHQLQQSVRHIVLDKELYSSWGNPTVTLAAAPMVTIERAGTSTGTMLASCTVTGTLSPRT